MIWGYHYFSKPPCIQVKYTVKQVAFSLTHTFRLVIRDIPGPNDRALEPWFLRKRRAAPSVLHGSGAPVTTVGVRGVDFGVALGDAPAAATTFFLRDGSTPGSFFVIQFWF